MGNLAQPTSPSTLAGAYFDPGVRTLRQLQTFYLPQTVTSATATATANAIPQRTQGDEIFGFYFTPYSTSSWIEFEMAFNIIGGNSSGNYWIALFADYSNDALVVSPGTWAVSQSYLQSIFFNHYLAPLTTTPTRFSIRSSVSAGSIVFNYFNYGGRNVSRVTVKEWSSLSLTNT